MNQQPEGFAPLLDTGGGGKREEGQGRSNAVSPVTADQGHEEENLV